MRNSRLSPLQPYEDAGDHHDHRQHELTRRADPAQLPPRHRDAPVLWRFRADRDQVFIRREPVDGVHGKVAVAVEINKSVHGPRRASDHHEPSLRILFSGRVAAGSGESERPLFILRIVHIDRRRTQVAVARLLLEVSNSFCTLLLSLPRSPWSVPEGIRLRSPSFLRRWVAIRSS